MEGGVGHGHIQGDALVLHDVDTGRSCGQKDDHGRFSSVCGLQAFPLQGLTVDAVQRPPGGRFGGLRSDAVDLFGTEAQEQDEDEGDEEAGQQQDGHHDDLLLVHTDLCRADRGVTSVSLVTTATPE